MTRGTEVSSSRKSKRQRRTNPIARARRTPTFRQRKARPKKGRGSYSRARATGRLQQPLLFATGIVFAPRRIGFAENCVINFCISHYGRAQVGSTQVGPTQLGSTQGGANQVGCHNLALFKLAIFKFAPLKSNATQLLSALHFFKSI